MTGSADSEHINPKGDNGMQYFAIGEDNGGAGERRLGPFDTADEAQAAGQRETKDSNGGFIFRGIVDEANNQVGFDIEPIVSTNAVVMNALAANRRVAKNADSGKIAKAKSLFNEAINKIEQARGLFTSDKSYALSKSLFDLPIKEIEEQKSQLWRLED